jgi:uncharacterized protein (DUF433 family)
MTVTLHTDPLPLRVDEAGTIRIGTSRVTLDVVLADYLSGMSPETIVSQLDTLSLADVHAAIAYFLRHRLEVEEYLVRRRAEAEELRQKIEADQPNRANLKAELLARMALRNGGHASTTQSAAGP